MDLIAILLAFLGLSNIYNSISKLLDSNYYNKFYVLFGKETLFIKSEVSFLVVNFIGLIIGVLAISTSLGIWKRRKFSYYLSIFISGFYSFNIICGSGYNLIKDSGYNLDKSFYILMLLFLILFILIIRKIVKNKSYFC
ncbi:hypothetical protein [Dethiothermospora halolimnae]|uniref:hypothetical protein n=1 Tax=Dethiothermospora halolimnae TaxID=3114390 RepID=UPI003CCC02DB